MKIDLSKTLKSKTIRGLIIVVVALLLQTFAIAPQEVAQTIDDLGPSWNQVTPEQSDPLVALTKLAQLAGLAYAAYGRTVAKQPLVKEKEKDDAA